MSILSSIIQRCKQTLLSRSATTKKPFLLQHARTVFISSQKNTIALSVLENHPQAVTVLFYPGTMASPHMYGLFLEELHAAGCNVVGIHPLSHGLSPKKQCVFTFDDILQNGKDAQIWAEHYFSGPVVVSGHSQGGILALAHALNNPTLAACFPMGTLLPHNEKAGSVTRFEKLLRHRELFLRVVGFLARIFPFLPIPFWLYLQPKRIFAHAHKVFAPANGVRFWYPLAFISSLFHKDLHETEKNGAIQCPLFLLSAKNDTLFTWPLMQEIFASLQAPQKKLIAIAGGGHLCVVSRVYAKQMAAFIAAECAGLGLPIYIKKQR